MSQSRPIKVFPIWQADPAGDAHAVKGTLTSFTFDLVEDPGALGTDAQRWVFEGSLEKGKWILKDTVPWTHARVRVITDHVELDASRRLSTRVIESILNLLSYKYIAADKWLLVALKGKVRVCKLYTFLPLAVHTKEETGTIIRIELESILGPAFRKEGISGLNALSPADAAKLDAKAAEMYKPTGDYTLRTDDTHQQALPHAGQQPHSGDDGGWDSYATAHDPVDKSKYGVGDNVTVCVYLDGKALRGHPTTGVITGRGDMIRMSGEHTDKPWPPASRVNHKHCTWTIERTTTGPSRETEEWANTSTELDAEDITSWDTLFELDREQCQNQIKQLLYARASELGVPVREDTPLWTAIRALLDFTDMIWDLEDDWKKNERLAKMGYGLQQELRIQLYGAQGYSIKAMRMKSKGATTKTDPVSLSIKEQDKELNRNNRGGGRGGGLTWGRGGGGRGGRARGGNCYNCGEPGHLSRNCPQVQRPRNALMAPIPQSTALVNTPLHSAARPVVTCAFCSAPFHTADKCWRNPASTAFRGPNTPPAFSKTGFQSGGAQSL